MTRRRTLLGLLVLALAVWFVVARTGTDHPARPADRPAHLLPLRPADIVAVDVRATATGRTATLAGDTLRPVRDDLAPLLAIRLLPSRRPEYGLDPPALDVVVHTAAGGTDHVLVGAANFDRTGVYAAVGSRTATILPELADRLAAAVGLSSIT